MFPPYLDSALVIRAMRIEPGDAVLDVGSGSGVIAVFAAFKAKHVRATDINPAAVETIRANAARHGLEDRLTAVCADLFPPGVRAAFDVVTFNPPYTDHPASDEVGVGILGAEPIGRTGREAVKQAFSKKTAPLRSRELPLPAQPDVDQGW